MRKNMNKTLISTLAELLVGKQVETGVVATALDLVCSNATFDSGFIYEIDQKNIFYLKEHHAHGNAQIRETFSNNDIDPAYRSYLAQDEIFYLHRDSACSPNETALLNLFFAESLVLLSIVDENSRIKGFIVFVRNSLQSVLQNDELKLLTTLLYMIGRYISVRIYINTLAFAQSSLANILDNTGIDIYVNDFYTHDILYVNKSMAAPYGGVSCFLDHKCWEVLFPGQNGPCEFCPQTKLVDEHGTPSKIYSWDYQRAFDGSWFRVFSAAFRWIDGRLAHVVSSANITENKRNEQLIEYMANYDALTGLPNRRMLIKECKRRITHATVDEKGYLLFFDIDGFKAINDNFGHSAGDEFLVMLGEFFSGIPMLKNAIYRNGGDEFVGVIGGNDVTQAHILSLIGFIHERFKKPWELEKGPVFCNTSVGVACYPQDGSTAEELLGKADQAMYKIKKAGGSGVCFAHNLNS